MKTYFIFAYLLLAVVSCRSVNASKNCTKLWTKLAEMEEKLLAENNRTSFLRMEVTRHYKRGNDLREKFMKCSSENQLCLRHLHGKINSSTDIQLCDKLVNDTNNLLVSLNKEKEKRMIAENVTIVLRADLFSSRKKCQQAEQLSNSRNISTHEIWEQINMKTNLTVCRFRLTNLEAKLSRLLQIKDGLLKQGEASRILVWELRLDLEYEKEGRVKAENQSYSGRREARKLQSELRECKLNHGDFPGQISFLEQHLKTLTTNLEQCRRNNPVQAECSESEKKLQGALVLLKKEQKLRSRAVRDLEASKHNLDVIEDECTKTEEQLFGCKKQNFKKEKELKTLRKECQRLNSSYDSVKRNSENLEENIQELQIQNKQLQDIQKGRCLKLETELLAMKQKLNQTVIDSNEAEPTCGSLSKKLKNVTDQCRMEREKTLRDCVNSEEIRCQREMRKLRSQLNARGNIIKPVRYNVDCSKDSNHGRPPKLLFQEATEAMRNETNNINNGEPSDQLSDPMGSWWWELELGNALLHDSVAEGFNEIKQGNTVWIRSPNVILPVSLRGVKIRADFWMIKGTRTSRVFFIIENNNYNKETVKVTFPFTFAVELKFYSADTKKPVGDVLNKIIILKDFGVKGASSNVPIPNVIMQQLSRPPIIHVIFSSLDTISRHWRDGLYARPPRAFLPEPSGAMLTEGSQPAHDLCDPSGVWWWDLEEGHVMNTTTARIVQNGSALEEFSKIKRGKSGWISSNFVILPTSLRGVKIEMEFLGLTEHRILVFSVVNDSYNKETVKVTFPFTFAVELKFYSAKTKKPVEGVLNKIVILKAFGIKVTSSLVSIPNIVMQQLSRPPVIQVIFSSLDTKSRHWRDGLYARPPRAFMPEPTDAMLIEGSQPVHELCDPSGVWWWELEEGNVVRNVSALEEFNNMKEGKPGLITSNFVILPASLRGVKIRTTFHSFTMNKLLVFFVVINDIYNNETIKVTFPFKVSVDMKFYSVDTKKPVGEVFTKVVTLTNSTKVQRYSSFEVPILYLQQLSRPPVIQVIFSSPDHKDRHWRDGPYAQPPRILFPGPTDAMIKELETEGGMSKVLCDPSGSWWWELDKSVAIDDEDASAVFNKMKRGENGAIVSPNVILPTNLAGVKVSPMLMFATMPLVIFTVTFDDYNTKVVSVQYPYRIRVQLQFYSSETKKPVGDLITQFVGLTNAKSLAFKSYIMVPILTLSQLSRPPIIHVVFSSI